MSFIQDTAPKAHGFQHGLFSRNPVKGIPMGGACLLVLFCASALAQSETTTPAAVVLPKQAGNVTVGPQNPAYPAALVASGVQGSVTILAQVNGDGTVADATVHETSRSPELDAIARDIVGKSTFPGAKSTMAELKQMVLVPVDFRKDTSADIPAKTCADFNVDAAYFKGKFPELPVSKMTVFQLATGIKFLLVAPGQQVALAKRLNGAIGTTITTCEATPSRKFFDVFGQALGTDVPE